MKDTIPLCAVLEAVALEVTWACPLAWVLAVALGLRPAWPVCPAGRRLLLLSLHCSFALNLGEHVPLTGAKNATQLWRVAL